MSEMTLQRDKIVSVLEESGISAKTAFPFGERKREEKAFVLVSLEKMTREPVGFQHYLGERSVGNSDAVEEVYGSGIEMTFSLLAHSPKTLGAETCESLAEEVTEKLLSSSLEDLTMGALSWDALFYDREKGYFCQKALLETSGTAYSILDEFGVFETFDVKGGISLE